MRSLIQYAERQERERDQAHFSNQWRHCWDYQATTLSFSVVTEDANGFGRFTTHTPAVLNTKMVPISEDSCRLLCGEAGVVLSKGRFPFLRFVLFMFAFALRFPSHVRFSEHVGPFPV